MKNTFYSPFDLEFCPETGHPRKEEPQSRSHFQVDRDRVVFSQSFRKLQSKTQVFQSGEYDFYRTRLTHSLEVARIGRSLCDYLQWKHPEILQTDFHIDSDLVEAIGLAHDIGHPPFGHIGERKLNQLMAPYGGFEGNAQTLRILTRLIYPRAGEPLGMYPTRAFLDGVLKYKPLWSESSIMAEDGSLSRPDNHFLYDEQVLLRSFVYGESDVPGEWKRQGNWRQERSLECLIMDWADDTAYSLHDMADGIRACFLSVQLLEKWGAKQKLSTHEESLLVELCSVVREDLVDAVFGSKIGRFIQAAKLVERPHSLAGKTRRYAYSLELDPEQEEACAFYKKVALDLIFLSPQIQQIEFKNGRMLERLFNAFFENHVYGGGKLKLLPEPYSLWVAKADSEAEKARWVCDYLAGLTDQEAIRIYRRLFDPVYGSITDLT